MLNLTEYRKKPKILADYLPWAALVAPGVVLNKDGSFQRTARYRGPDLDSATGAELVSITARVNNILRRFGSGWALFFEADRQPAMNYPDSSFPDMASWLVDEERKAQFLRASNGHQGQAVPHYETAYYLTCLYLPPSDTGQKAESLLYESDPDQKGKQVHGRDYLEYFLTQTERTFDLLSTLLPQITPLNDRETLTYLHGTISTKRHKVAVPDIPVYLDAILPDMPLTGGVSPKLGEEHVRSLSILGFPNTTMPGILDELNNLGLSYRWMTRWIALDKSQAEKTLNRMRRQWFAKRKSVAAVLREVMFDQASSLLDSDADNKAVDADAALQELGSDNVSFGYITTSITVLDPDSTVADEKLRDVERVINGRGFVTIHERLNAVEAWLGSLPGNAYANIRQPVVHTINLAHMMPVSAIWAGPKRVDHFNAPPLLMAKTRGSTPFRLSLHVGDVGHSLILGPTGAGKSVLLSLLALQFRRYQGAQVFMFDKGRSARAAVLAMGGRSYDLALDKGLSFQPLSTIDQPGSLAFALDWVLGLLANEGVEIKPDVKQSLWSALQSLSKVPQNERTLTGLSLLLQSNDLRQALQPFTLDGAYGRLLDGDEDGVRLSDVIHFEMEELLHHEKLVLPVLTYLFHKLEARFDGRPTLLILDEAWVFLDHPFFASKIREWLKTLRKKNVSVIFATQSLADIAQSAIAPALIESCPTRLFLPNERGLEPQIHDAYERFGLNDRQVELITTALPKRDYYLQSARGNRLFQLGLGPVALSLCGSSRPEDHKLMDQLDGKKGEAFLKVFMQAKGFEWVNDLTFKP
jgi:type IV secretion system protein VirB4